MDLGQLLQHAAHAAQAFAPGGSPVLDLISPWVQRLALSAPGRWLPVLARHEACGHSRCRTRAVVECVSCGRSVCLGHALIGAEAQGICHDCVLDVASRTDKPKDKRRAPEPLLRAEPVKPAHSRRDPFAGLPAEVRDAYQHLGCLPSDGDEEVNVAFKTRQRFAKKAEQALLVKSLKILADHRSAS
jgi:hypothetical protein